MFRTVFERMDADGVFPGQERAEYAVAGNDDQECVEDSVEKSKRIFPNGTYRRIVCLPIVDERLSFIPEAVIKPNVSTDLAV